MRIGNGATGYRHIKMPHNHRSRLFVIAPSVKSSKVFKSNLQNFNVTSTNTLLNTAIRMLIELLLTILTYYTLPVLSGAKRQCLHIN